MSDEERAYEVFKMACKTVDSIFVPVEILITIAAASGIGGGLFGIPENTRIRPEDAVCVAYLLGKCNGNLTELEAIINDSRLKAG